MKFLYADWLLVCDDDFRIIKNGAIAFDEKIQDIGNIEEFREKNPLESIQYMGLNSVLIVKLEH